jgi:hypothetical protein
LLVEKAGLYFGIMRPKKKLAKISKSINKEHVNS